MVAKGGRKSQMGNCTVYMQLSGAACTFAQDAISPLWVHKRKKGTVIPVQVKSHHYIKCICSYWLASNHWGTFWKKPDLSFCLNFLEYLLCMIIQVTNKARRWYNIRVSQAAPSGAPQGSRKKSTLKKQMVVTEDGEDVFHKLPGAKKKQPTNKHNLLEAVKNVRGQKKALIKRIHFEFLALISR